MTAKINKIKSEDKEKYKIYLDRSKQLFEESMVASKAQRWAAVGLNAVHSALSMNDALTVYYLQRKSIADDHRISSELLSEIQEDDVNDQVSNYKRIIAKKYAVSYEDREFREKEAQEVLKQTERFFHWGLRKLTEK